MCSENYWTSFGWRKIGSTAYFFHIARDNSTHYELIKIHFHLLRGLKSSEHNPYSQKCDWVIPQNFLCSPQHYRHHQQHCISVSHHCYCHAISWLCQCSGYHKFANNNNIKMKWERGGCLNEIKEKYTIPAKTPRIRSNWLSNQLRTIWPHEKWQQLFQCPQFIAIYFWIFSHLVEISFGPQTCKRDDHTPLQPTTPFFISCCRVICWLPARFIHPVSGTKNGARCNRRRGPIPDTWPSHRSLHN